MAFSGDIKLRSQISKRLFKGLNLYILSSLFDVKTRLL